MKFKIKKTKKDIDYIEVTLTATIRDGGTKCYESKDKQEYWIDGRIGSVSKGLWYNDYPNIETAKILDMNIACRLKIVNEFSNEV